MIKINEMKPGTDNCEFEAIISQVTVGKTNGNNKSNYLSIVFQDDTGMIDAKLWTATQEQISEFISGTVVRGVGDIIQYNESRQMKVASLKTVSRSHVDQVKFLKRAPESAESLNETIHVFISDISNMKLYALVKELYGKYEAEFSLAPAASRNHHEYVSGLIYHTVSMLRIAKSLITIYPTLNSDLLYAGIILHDLGKVIELSGPVVPSYTLEGKLLGHISITQALIKETADALNLEGEEITLLQHMILSHHGKNEFGSPVLPQIKEAEILYLIDNIDSRMDMFNKALSQVEPGEYTKRIFPLENRMIYKPKFDEELS